MFTFRDISMWQAPTTSPAVRQNKCEMRYPNWVSHYREMRESEGLQPTASGCELLGYYKIIQADGSGSWS